VLDLFDLLINGRYARTDARGIPCRAATAWKEGKVRPTAQPAVKAVRWWRSRRDPFETTWPLLRQWFKAEPEWIGRELFERLQAEHPGVYPKGSNTNGVDI
jgi:hypothetical protein